MGASHQSLQPQLPTVLRRNRWPPRSRVAALLIVVGGGLGSCASASDPAPATLEDIQRLIGTAACTSDDACRTVGVGALACGGPESYLSWSVPETNDQALQQAVASPNPNWWAAGAFYLLFPLGLLIFAVLPYADSPVWKAALMGALYCR